MESITCKHEGCQYQAREVLIAQPSPEMILDGEAAAHFVCGQDGHTAANMMGAIRQYDRNAKFVIFHAAEPVAFGQVFAALATGTGQ